MTSPAARWRGRRCGDRQGAIRFAAFQVDPVALAHLAHVLNAQGECRSASSRPAKVEVIQWHYEIPAA